MQNETPTNVRKENSQTQGETVPVTTVAPREESWSHSIPDSVDERDVYSLIRARWEYDNASQATGSRLTAPQLRDFTHFHGRFEYILDQNPDIGDPLYFTCQMVLGLVDSEGYRYFDLVKLDKPVPTAAREKERADCKKKEKEGKEESKRLLAEQIRKSMPAYVEWPEEARRAASEFADHLQTARHLLRRYPDLVKADTFPQPFLFALQHADGGEADTDRDPDSEVVDYSDFPLIKQGILVCLDDAITARANGKKEKKQDNTEHAAGRGAGAAEITPKADARKKPKSFVPKPDAPEWVTNIPEPTDAEPEVEYQLQAVVGIYSDPCVLSRREYEMLVFTLAKMRGHLRETTGGQENG